MPPKKTSRSTKKATKQASKTVTKKAPSTPTKSLFSAGKIPTNSPEFGKKDDSHRAFFEAFVGGVAVLWFMKAYVDEEPYLNYDYKKAYEDADYRNDLNIVGVVERKGSDGRTALPQKPKSKYNWRQFLVVVGDNTTAGQRRLVINRILDQMNTNAFAVGNYDYPKEVRFVKDKTMNPPRRAECRMLDKDIVKVMLMAHSPSTVEEMSADDTIVSLYWRDINHGAEVLMSYAGGATVSEILGRARTEAAAASHGGDFGSGSEYDNEDLETGAGEDLNDTLEQDEHERSGDDESYTREGDHDKDGEYKDEKEDGILPGDNDLVLQEGKQVEGEPLVK